MLEKIFYEQFLKAGKFAHSNKRESDISESELAAGIKIEAEHTDNIQIAKKIALDHLTEIPDYYTRLAKMESDAKKALNLT